MASRLYWVLLAILQAVMLVELVLLVRASRWVTALQVLIIMDSLWRRWPLGPGCR
jgi:hypothetical protein